jgi:hypothetical protein
MTTTTSPRTDSLSTTTRTKTPATRQLVKAGAIGGVAAAALTLGVAVTAKAIDVPLEAAGEAFPVVAFPQLTLFFTAVGVVIAMLCRRAAHPQRTFERITVTLTVLSFAAPFMLDADLATKITLNVGHLVAAAVVIPVLAMQLPRSHR